MIVVDGGSTDATVQRAREAGATVLTSKPGRARQMNAGAAAAEGGSLLFVHADTLLPPGWAEVVPRTLRTPGVAAGAFRFRIAGSFAGKSFIEWTTGLRSRWLQRPYGDQGLFLARALFEEMGGFADLPIMEDYEFAARLRRRGRIVTVGEAALTSARRWKSTGSCAHHPPQSVDAGGLSPGREPTEAGDTLPGHRTLTLWPVSLDQPKSVALPP